MNTQDFIYWNEFWNQQGSNVPWETNELDETFVNYVDNCQIKNMLEIGCGSGINSTWAAEKAKSVTALDISATAINLARMRTTKNNLQFQNIDFFQFETDIQYDFIFDRGCFHGLRSHYDKVFFVEKISYNISDQGQWLSIIGSAENVNDNEGPPRHTLSDIVSIIEPFLKIVKITECFLKNRNGILSPAWAVISEKRTIPINKTS